VSWWDRIVALCAWLAGRRAGAAEARQDVALKFAEERADVAEAIATAVVAMPPRRELPDQLRRGEF
jgi:hypothetical protein